MTVPELVLPRHPLLQYALEQLDAGRDSMRIVVKPRRRVLERVRVLSKPVVWGEPLCEGPEGLVVLVKVSDVLNWFNFNNRG